MISIITTIKFTSLHLFSIVIIHLPSKLYSICFLLVMFLPLCTPHRIHLIHSSSPSSCALLIMSILHSTYHSPSSTHRQCHHTYTPPDHCHTLFPLHLNYNYIILSCSCFFVVFVLPNWQNEVTWLFHTIVDHPFSNQNHVNGKFFHGQH